MLSSITFRGAGGATRQWWHRLSASVSMPTCAVVFLAIAFFSNPCALMAAAAAQQEVTRDFQKAHTLTPGNPFASRTNSAKCECMENPAAK